MNSDEMMKVFDALWQDIKTEDACPVKRPLLAHYTSIETLERIMASDEVWFSNPLYMNDMEELRFGMQEGLAAFRLHAGIKEACKNVGHDYNHLLSMFEYLYQKFDNTDAFDTYVFCMAEHEEARTDGLLSMWRGYGGNGNGAAIVFDTSKFNFPDSLDCLFLWDVTYASQQERRAWIDIKLWQFATMLDQISVPVHMLYQPLQVLFERLKIYSLFTKHHGFSEEREWRAVYLRDRDHDNVLQPMLHYAVGRYGLEPKLKFAVKAIPGFTPEDFSLKQIVNQILLGPSVSSPLAVMSVKRMLQAVEKPELADRLVASTTPFRSL